MLTSKLPKEAADQFCYPLCLLKDKSFEDSELPDVWKIKKYPQYTRTEETKLNTTDFRPVYLKCIPCKKKKTEKIVRDVVMKHGLQ